MAKEYEQNIEYLIRSESRKMAQKIVDEIKPLIREDTINDISINYPMAFNRDNFARLHDRINNRLFRMVLDMARPPLMYGIQMITGKPYIVFAYVSRKGEYKFGKVLLNDIFIDEATFNSKYPTKVTRDVQCEDPDYIRFIKSIM